MRDQAASKRGIIIAFALFVVMLVYAISVAGIPRLVGNALFSSQPYASHSTSITAQVDSDTALNVTEQREFSFSGKTTCIRWTHNDLTSESEIAMRGMRVSVLDESGNAVESFELEAVPFKKEWRDTDGKDGVGPGHPCYSIDDMNRTVYTFFEAENKDVVFTIDYTVENGIVVWRDIAELNWTILTGDWSMDSEDFSVSLQLPVMANALVSPGKNVNAWAHGPQNGSVSISETGVVLYETKKATAGQWASLHVTFPSVWITNLPDTKFAQQHANELHLDSSISSEKDWVDASSAAQIRGHKFDILVLGLPLLVLAFGVIVFLRNGRDFKPNRNEESSEAASSLHPALAGRLLRWNRQSEDDFAAAIEHLAQNGLVLVEEIGDETALDFHLVRTEVAADDEIDKATLEALFGGLTSNLESVALSDIAACANENKDAYCETLATWNHVLDHQVSSNRLFDKKSFSWQVRLFALAALLLLVSLFAQFAAGSGVLLGASLPVVFIGALLANYMPRRTQKGQDIAACLVELSPEVQDTRLHKALVDALSSHQS